LQKYKKNPIKQTLSDNFYLNLSLKISAAIFVHLSNNPFGQSFIEPSGLIGYT
jgi:hypothetical protein